MQNEPERSFRKDLNVRLSWNQLKQTKHHISPKTLTINAKYDSLGSNKRKALTVV